MRHKQAKTDVNSPREITTLGGGCFWSMEATFNEIRGVEKVQSGYSGGTLANPTYEEVSTGTTGHAEVAQISFDPSVVSFRELLDVFFTIHDPTSVNQQGPDVGPQYRSVIFYHSPEQKAIAEQVIDELNSRNLWKAPIVTQIEPYKAFYKAEEYHDDYFNRHPELPYCKFIIAPKIVKFREQHRDKLKSVRA